METLNKDNVRMLRGRVMDYLELAFPKPYDTIMCRRTEEGLYIYVERRRTNLISYLIPYRTQYFLGSNDVAFYLESETITISRAGITLGRDTCLNYYITITGEPK